VRNVFQVGVAGFAQYFLVFWVHGDDFVPMLLHVFRSEIRGAKPVGRQTDNGQSAVVLQNVAKGSNVAHKSHISPKTE
jgi:hypothetical protein